MGQRKTPEERTVAYVQHRVEVELPEQIERAEQVLGRITLKHHGQLELGIDYEQPEI